MMSDQAANPPLHFSELLSDFPKTTQQGWARTRNQTQVLSLQIYMCEHGLQGGEAEVGCSDGFSPHIICEVTFFSVTIITCYN